MCNTVYTVICVTRRIRVLTWSASGPDHLANLLVKHFNGWFVTGGWYTSPVQKRNYIIGYYYIIVRKIDTEMTPAILLVFVLFLRKSGCLLASSDNV